MANLAQRAASEALFGSASRGDSDSLSDNDILIVDDDVAILQSRTRELTARGWSVASYTFKKLEALSKKGALFLQHLKLEATVLRDQHHRLSGLLHSFNPKSDYSVELVENARLARLAAVVPSGPRGTLFSADILYVAARNYGVMKLAELGTHVYSYQEILEALEERKLLSSNGSSALASLRFLKCLYRSGEQLVGSQILTKLNDIVSYMPSADFPTSVESASPFAVVSEPAPPSPASAYLLLRDLERRFIAAQALTPQRSIDDEFRKLSAWIANPRAYAALSACVAPELRLALEAKSADLVASRSNAAIRV